MNTYDCKKAIAVSNPVTQKMIIKGKIETIKPRAPIEIILHTNPINIFIENK